jgi:hypothetical protein
MNGLSFPRRAGERAHKRVCKIYKKRHFLSRHDGAAPSECLIIKNLLLNEALSFFVRACIVLAGVLRRAGDFFISLYIIFPSLYNLLSSESGLRKFGICKACGRHSKLIKRARCVRCFVFGQKFTRPGTAQVG